MSPIIDIAIKQEQAHNLLGGLRLEPDLPFEVAAVLRTQYSDEVIVDLALVHREMQAIGRPGQEDLDPIDFVWAVDFLDRIAAFRLDVTRIDATRAQGE